jgi:hypothetical protein
MPGCQNDPIRITPLRRGSPPGSPICCFSRLHAAIKWQSIKTLKDGKGEKRSPEKETNYNEMCRICQVNIKLTHGNCATKSCPLFRILQRLETYNYNYIEFAFFDILQSVQLLRLITSREIHGFDFDNLVVYNAG